MKKIFAFSLAALALLAVSCNKEIAPEPVDNNNQAEAPVMVDKTFTVSAPENTKTALSGMNILWSADDEINVIAKTSGNQYTFTLSSGAGTAKATFSGAVDAADEGDEFYAVYPNVAIDASKLTAATPLIEFKNTMGRKRLAVKDGFDPKHSVLTAVADGDGNFAFRHGSAYFKIKITDENVDSVIISTSGARFSGRPQYNLDGSYNNIQGAKDDVVLAPESGVLENGATYYIPVLCKNSSIKTLTVKAFNHNGKTSVVSTDKKSSVKLELGKVYDLGAPNITTDPILTLTKTTIDGIAADAATGLTSDGVYALRNCSDSDIAVTCDGTIVTAASVADGTVTFSVSANTGDAREGWIGLAVPGGAVQKIAVKQLASGASEDYSWDFSSTGWQNALQAQASDACRETNGNNNATFNVSYDGLSYTSGSGNGKWSNTGYIMPNGAGYYKSADKRRYWSFSTTNDGYVYVWLSGTGNSAKKAKVNVQHGAKDTADWISAEVSLSVNDTERVELAIEAGDQILYLNNGMQVKKIEFHQNQLTD